MKWLNALLERFKRLTAVPVESSGRYRSLIDNVQRQNRWLWGTNTALLGILAFLSYALHYSRQHLPPVHIPPDLRFGATVAWGQIPNGNVYLFAGYIYQQLNLWQEDGAKDYAQNIFRLQYFLTPKYRAESEADLAWRAKRGELQGRVRALTPLSMQGYEPKRVEVLGAGRWRIWIDFAIQESVKGMGVKQTWVRYPLEVLLIDADPEHNPWGLALDGFNGQDPVRLTAESAKEAFALPSVSRIAQQTGP